MLDIMGLDILGLASTCIFPLPSHLAGGSVIVGDPCCFSISLLSYVSSYGYNDYKAYCQHKLLRAVPTHTNTARSLPPCLLEWESAKNFTTMALKFGYPEGTLKCRQCTAQFNEMYPQPAVVCTQTLLQRGKGGSGGTASHLLLWILLKA